MKARTDVTALVFGTLFLFMAALGLWMAFGDPSWTLVGSLIPLGLVAVGVLGLSLTRNRT